MYVCSILLMVLYALYIHTYTCSGWLVYKAWSETEKIDNFLDGFYVINVKLSQ